jgi:hypothetical protein
MDADIPTHEAGQKPWEKGAIQRCEEIRQVKEPRVPPNDRVGNEGMPTEIFTRASRQAPPIAQPSRPPPASSQRASAKGDQAGPVAP